MVPIGRVAELGWLGDRLAAGGQVVVVSGEAGVGKSHLLAAAVPREQVHAWASFPSGRFPPPGFGLRRLAEQADPQPNALLAELDGSVEDAGPGKELSIWHAADALLRGAGPGVVVLDDVQWADDLTLGWLGQAADLLAGSALTVVLGVRAAEALPDRIEDALLSLGRRDLVDRLVLAPLPAPAVGELAAALGVTCDADAAQALYDRTDGLPLAVREVLRHMGYAESGTLAADDLHRLPAAPTLPLLGALLREELTALPEDARELVQTASLLPPRQPERTLAAVTGWPDARFDEALAAALRSGLVVPAGAGVAFRHELHREVLAGQLGLADRRARHRQVAEVLAGRADAVAGDVADQYLEAGDEVQALDWLERAARDALAAHDYGTALASVRAALPIARVVDRSRVKALADQAVVTAQWSNRIVPGLDFLSEALPGAATTAERGWLLLGQARLLAYVGDYATRSGVLTMALHEFRESDDELGVAQVFGHLGYPVATPLPLATCVAHAREGLRIAERAGDRRTVALCASTLALALQFAGTGDERYWRQAAEALAEPETAGETHTARTVLGNWAVSLVSLGKYADAAAVLERAGRVCTGTYSEQMFAATTAVQRWRTGDWDGALAAADRALSGPRYAQVVVAEVVRAAIRHERERRPDPAPLEQAAAQLVRQRNPAWAPIAQTTLMRVRAARREPRPDRELTEMIEDFAARELAYGWEDLLAAAAEVSPALCRRTLDRLGTLRPTGPRAEAVSQYVEGLLAPRGAAAELLLDAAARFGDLPEPYLRARALQAAAEATTRHRHTAGDLRAEAATIYQGLGADRSLAVLLRSSAPSRPLEGFRVPASQARAAAVGLTPREREVADLARQGLTVAEIAERLSISFGTARNHLMHVREKFGGVRKRDLTRLLGEASADDAP